MRPNYIKNGESQKQIYGSNFIQDKNLPRRYIQYMNCEEERLGRKLSKTDSTLEETGDAVCCLVKKKRVSVGSY
jgi:hypothetical protein